MENDQITKRVTEEEMYASLSRAYKADREQSLRWQLLRKLQHPIQPRNAKGGFRLHPLVLIFVLLLAALVGTFFYFGIHP
jgi:hypothetical protein